jgi:heme-degrading monooxygenase HmoA
LSVVLPQVSPVSTPPPPYYAVIFTSCLSDSENSDYQETADRMVELAHQQDGFLGVESARSGLGITVSYWRDLASISAWKQQAEHLDAQMAGRKSWYRAFEVRIAHVERAYGMKHRAVENG